MSEVPKFWLPPDEEAVAEQQELLDLLDQSFVKSTYEEKIIWQEKLTTYSKLANACWSGPRDTQHAPPVYATLVENRKLGQEWLMKIEKSLKGKAALTTETAWAKMGEAGGDSFVLCSCQCSFELICNENKSIATFIVEIICSRLIL